MEQSGKSPTASLCSIKGETSDECDPINISEGDLQVKSDCQPPSDYEEMNFNKKKTKHLLIQFWLYLNG